MKAPLLLTAILGLVASGPLCAEEGDANPDAKEPLPWLDEVRAQRRAWERALQAMPPATSAPSLGAHSRRRHQALRDYHAQRRQALEERRRQWEQEQERRHQWFLEHSAPPGWNNLWYYRGY